MTICPFCSTTHILPNPDRYGPKWRCYHGHTFNRLEKVGGKLEQYIR